MKQLIHQHCFFPLRSLNTNHYGETDGGVKTRNKEKLRNGKQSDMVLTRMALLFPSSHPSANVPGIQIISWQALAPHRACA